MAQIDLFVRNMWKLGANGVVMVSGANVTMKLPTGDRFAAQNTPHATLVGMIEEVATEKVLAQLRRGQSAEFPYMMSGSAVRVRVDQVGKSWRVEISPISAAPDEPKPGSTSRLTGPQTPVSTPSSSAFTPTSSTAPRAFASVPNIPVSPSSRPDLGADSSAFGGSGSPSSPAPSVPRLERAPAPAPSPPPKRDRTSRTFSAGGPTLSVEGHGVDRLLRRMRDLGASDLHLTTGCPPSLRIDGEIRTLEEGPLSQSELLSSILSLAPEGNRTEFNQKSDTDFAHEIAGVGRFRVNVFRDRRGPCAVVRMIPLEVRKPAELGLPSEVLELCSLKRGLVLVTGPTGSGKSTTLASLIDHVNENRADHIITIEDPIEFIHESKRCLVHQREVGPHTRTFQNALRAALREDPDVLLVGELRDLETVAMAVETAETGHLVFGTLHTSTAASTVERVIDQFPGERQDQIRQMLSESLRAVIAQTLCRKIGGGRVAAYEILFNNGAVANLIRERKTHQIGSVIQTGRGAGMVSLNDSLIDLVRKKLVDPREALDKAGTKNDFRMLLQREGIRLEAAA